MKCVFTWKICVTQGTSVFQMTNAQCCKISSKQKMDFHVKMYGKFQIPYYK